MTNDEYRIVKKDKKKELKKLGKAVRTLVIGLVIGLCSAFVFPENLFRLLGTGLTKLIGASLSDFIVVATEGIGIIGGALGFLVGATKASKAKAKIETLDDKADDYVYELTTKIEELNKEINSLSKGYKKSKDKTIELQRKVNELTAILEKVNGEGTTPEEVDLEIKSEKHYSK